MYNQREVEEQKRSDELKYYTQRNSDLLITNNGITSNSSYTICEGKITNKGKDSYKFIKIKGSFVDGNGNVVDTDWTYAIGGEGLSPGESTTWRLSVDKDTSIKDCKIIYTE